MNETLADWQRAGATVAFRGHSVFYRRSGVGAAVLAIHGYPTSSWDWSRIWSSLAANHDVIAPDMLGFGLSDKPMNHTYSIAEQTDLHEELLLSLGIREAHVVAHDLGTAIAQELVARAEEGASRIELHSVCFLNGNLFPEVYRPRFIQKVLASPFGGWVGPRVPRRMVEKAIRGLFGPDTQPSSEDLETFWQIIDGGQGRRVTHLLSRLIVERRVHRERWVGAMQKTRVPMRFVNGPADPNSGIHMANRYREVVSDADVVLLKPRIGHWPQLEAPDETARAVLELFARG